MSIWAWVSLKVGLFNFAPWELSTCIPFQSYSRFLNPFTIYEFWFWFSICNLEIQLHQRAATMMISQDFDAMVIDADLVSYLLIALRVVPIYLFHHSEAALPSWVYSSSKCYSKVITLSCQLIPGGELGEVAVQYNYFCEKLYFWQRKKKQNQKVQFNTDVNIYNNGIHNIDFNCYSSVWMALIWMALGNALSTSILNETVLLGRKQTCDILSAYCL